MVFGKKKNEKETKSKEDSTYYKTRVDFTKNAYHLQ